MENITDITVVISDINLFHKLCSVCNEVKRFPTRVNNKDVVVCSGRRCIRCCSASNNKKLREKEYYKTYYENNMEIFKARDKLRYDKVRKKNLVNFTINADNVELTETQ